METPTTNIGGFVGFFKSRKACNTLDLSNTTLLDCLQKRIEIEQRTSPRFGKQFRSLIKALTYIEEQEQGSFMPEYIDDDFWSKFIAYLEAQQKAPSSIRTICSQLKALLVWSAKHKASLSDTYDCYKLPQVEKRQVALTMDDISRIFHLNLKLINCRPQHRRTLERVRDMFCLLCNIGLRISDGIRLTPQHFKDGCITILQQKTKRYAFIDIGKMCIHKDMTFYILDKYDYHAPYTGDVSNFDKYLHEILDYCEFDEVVQQETIIQDLVVTRTAVRKELISSHTGRRTFVVNNALKGIPPLEIMRATGHKTFSAFQKYLCYSN